MPSDGDAEEERDWNRKINPMRRYKEGNLRGIQGAGNEQLVAARALKHGFIAFFKLWSDTKYDMVVECEQELFRIQIKGTQTGSVSFEGGQRGGIQRPISKIRHYTREDCDTIVGVDANTGDCYVFPIDYVEAVDSPSVNLKKMQAFRERWDYLTGNDYLTVSQAKNGLSRADLTSNLHRLHPNKPLPTELDELRKMFYESCPAPRMPRRNRATS